VSIYPTEIVKICSLDIGLIASKYDLSSVQSLKYTGTHIMPFHKHRLALKSEYYCIRHILFSLNNLA